MSRFLDRVMVAVGLLSVALSGFAQEKPGKSEIAKRGKAATAFVVVPDRGTGTAFCVHPSGLFITNEHVVRDAEKAGVTLVLNPAVEDQRELKAQVVRIDKKLDLALLRVDGAKDLPSLPLGSTKEVAELSEVVACGFPLGFLLSTDKADYPAISVNAGSVTALRYKDRELQHLQIDVAVTFGNSGGPVLDANGQVIGVVVSGIAGGGKGLNQAIPVNQLERFLNKPDIAFTAPTVTREMVDKPVEFQARIVSFVTEAPEPTLKLTLKPDDGEPREALMTKQGDQWVAALTLVEKPKSTRLEIAARIGTANVTGTTDDAVFKVAGRPMRLSGVRRIEFKDKPKVWLADERNTVEGEIVGLGMVDVDLAGQLVKIDLSKATQVTVQRALPVVSVLASVIAIVDGKEVARTEATLMVRDKASNDSSATPDPSLVKISPPVLDADKVVKRLPALFSDVVVGGGGRYLIFHLPKLKKLGLFDVNEARVTKYLPLSEENVAFAAGLDAIVVGLKDSGKLERWSLTTFELEKTAFPPFKDAIVSVVMGHGSYGPVVVNGQFLDLDTFKIIPVADQKGNRLASIGTEGRIPSADGTVYGAWNTHYSPAVSTTFVLEGGRINRSEAGDLHHVIPGPDGKTVFTAKGIASPTLHQSQEDTTYGYCLPAVRGEFFLSLSSASGGKGGGFTVYFSRLKRPIARLDKVEHGIKFDGWDRESFGPWKRVYLIPEAQVIVVLPSSNDQIVLHKFDADAALENAGEDYLLVTSRPPREASAGEKFTYALQVKSNQGGVTYRLDSGPKGMTISANGIVTWMVPDDAQTGDEDVILTVGNKSQQEIFHTFTIKVVR